MQSGTCNKKIFPFYLGTLGSNWNNDNTLNKCLWIEKKVLKKIIKRPKEHISCLSSSSQLQTNWSNFLKSLSRHLESTLKGNHLNILTLHNHYQCTPQPQSEQSWLSFTLVWYEPILIEISTVVLEKKPKSKELKKTTNQ